jgi:DNA polymerase/3'-5' exonuclease PolX
MQNKLNELISQLNELGDLEDSQFKSRAYKNAALTLASEFSDDKQLTSTEDFTYLYGIGTGINNKILEFLTTGTIAKLLTLRSESADYLDSRYYKVRKGFITKKLTYVEAEKLLIWVSHVTELFDKFHVAGSFRRNKEYIGDLDIMVHESRYEDVVNKLNQTVCKLVSRGEYKSQFIIDPVNNVPMDIISYTYEDEVYQLLYLTGSRETNIKMRKAAQEMGLTLNQYGLWNDKNENVLPNPGAEIDVFSFLGMKYLNPNER